jgi:hypothetical protein
MSDDDNRAARKQAADERAAALLSEGVPLSLLVDLAQPVESRQIYEDEGGDASWLARPMEPGAEG